MLARGSGGDDPRRAGGREPVGVREASARRREQPARRRTSCENTYHHNVMGELRAASRRRSRSASSGTRAASTVGSATAWTSGGTSSRATRATAGPRPTSDPTAPTRASPPTRAIEPDRPRHQRAGLPAGGVRPGRSDLGPRGRDGRRGQGGVLACAHLRAWGTPRTPRLRLVHDAARARHPAGRARASERLDGRDAIQSERTRRLSCAERLRSISTVAAAALACAMRTSAAVRGWCSRPRSRCGACGEDAPRRERRGGDRRRQADRRLGRPARAVHRLERGHREERLATIADIRAQLNQAGADGPTPDLPDDEAYALLERACANDFAEGFSLYKVYARGAAFSLATESSSP